MDLGQALTYIQKQQKEYLQTRISSVPEMCNKCGGGNLEIATQEQGVSSKDFRQKLSIICLDCQPFSIVEEFSLSMGFEELGNG